MVLWRKRLPQQRQLGSLASSAPFDDEREGDRQESTSRPKRRSSPFFVSLSFCHSNIFVYFLYSLLVADTVYTLAGVDLETQASILSLFCIFLPLVQIFVYFLYLLWKTLYIHWPSSSLSPIALLPNPFSRTYAQTIWRCSCMRRW